MKIKICLLFIFYSYLSIQIINCGLYLFSKRNNLNKNEDRSEKLKEEQSNKASKIEIINILF